MQVNKRSSYLSTGKILTVESARAMNQLSCRVSTCYQKKCFSVISSLILMLNDLKIKGGIKNNKLKVK